jgi:hypothetical protein
MKIELDLPEIEGYEYTGEYRIAEVMEYFMEELQASRLRESRTDSEYPILKKKAPKYLVIPCGGNIYGKTLVEIKALEDALKLMHGRTLNVDDMRVYTELKSLIS